MAQGANMRIGFVGIGNMGVPMCANLRKAGWMLTVFDVDTARAAAFAAGHGATAAASLKELAADSDVVITMLPDGKVVRSVTLDAGGLAEGLAKGAVIVDMSSSAPVGTRELGAELEDRGIRLVDAPVSGGVPRAVTGTLAIMAGGEEASVRGVGPVLDAMGKWIHVGRLGSGHAAKVLNNYVSAAGLAAAAEAVVVAERFGIDPDVIVDVLNASTGRNNATENKFKQFILNRRFDSGFAMGLMVKDLKLAMEVAKACDVPAELGQACVKLWADAYDRLGTGADHTEIARHVEPDGKA